VSGLRFWLYAMKWLYIVPCCTTVVAC